jgi:hypothetical protein
MQALADRLSMTLLCLEVLLENVRYVGEEVLVARGCQVLGKLESRDRFVSILFTMEMSLEGVQDPKGGRQGISFGVVLRLRR